MAWNSESDCNSSKDWGIKLVAGGVGEDGGVALTQRGDDRVE